MSNFWCLASDSVVAGDVGVGDVVVGDVGVGERQRDRHQAAGMTQPAA